MFKKFRHTDIDKTNQAVTKTRSRWFENIKNLLGKGEPLQEIYDDLEELLLGADVGLPVTETLLSNVHTRMSYEHTNDSETFHVLKTEMEAILQKTASSDSLQPCHHPHSVILVGVNGAGKTTSAAKLANWYKQQDYKVILGAADTFRPAAIEQLQIWGRRLDIDIVAHQQGADPSAVAFDTVQAGRKRQKDIVIIDTAGRLHNSVNLLQELRKIQRVVAQQTPSGSTQTLLTLDATTGQNGLSQARSFTESLYCEGIFLAKLDGTAKGGIVFAIAQELQIPVRFIGTGEQLSDIAVFDPILFVSGLFASTHSD